MPVHDWTLVEAGIFHDFHTVWTAALRTALNSGILPDGYYALAEQHAGQSIADVLTLHAEGGSAPSERPGGGTMTVVATPPKVRRQERAEASLLLRRRSVAIRHVSSHRLVALLEIVSPANKDRSRSVDDFAAKAVEALDFGIHVLVVDLFPPGPHDPQRMHAIIRHRLDLSDEPYALPANEPMMLARYTAVPSGVDMYIEHCAVGASLPPMPLFLGHGRYIDTPLEGTYLDAYRGLPAFWREVLEGRAPH